MREYRPVEKIVDRVVELWKRMLRSPKYDNGDSSPTGFMAGAFARMIPNNVTEERLQLFGEHLKTALMTPDPSFKGQEYYYNSLHVDYGPDGVLGAAAEKAELRLEFPWKTDMYFTQDSVHVSAGYGAEYVYHYSLSGGRWLITKLCGSDIAKVIEYVEGKVPAFNVEEGKA